VIGAASLVFSVITASQAVAAPDAVLLPPPPSRTARRGWGEDRALCEYTRQHTIGSWKSGGGLVGLTAGYLVGFGLARGSNRSDDAMWALAGLAAGYGVGYGLGALIGNGLAHRCEMVEWTDQSKAEWAEYLAEQGLYDGCMAKRNRVIGNWILAGTCVGAAIGALIPPASGESQDRLLYGLVGASFGMLIGSIIGPYSAPDCRFPQSIRFSMP